MLVSYVTVELFADQLILVSYDTVELFDDQLILVSYVTVELFDDQLILVSYVTVELFDDQLTLVFHQFVIPLVWYVIPWCVMAVLNTMLYSEVQRSSLVCKEVTNISTTSKKLSTVVLFIVLAHMVCSFPRCMVAVYNMVHAREGHGSSSNGHHCAPEIKSRTYTCITIAANILNVFNSCLNIVIYCGLGSKFRQEMKLYFGGCWRRNRVAPTTCVVVVASLETKMPASNARTVTS
nr:FMRFamide receptor-like [Biomphalaria glabrata]